MRDEASKAQIADLAASVESLKGEQQSFPQAAPEPASPVWACTQLPAGHVMSGDWEKDNFDSRSYTRYHYEKPFTSGFLHLWAPDSGGVGAADCPQRAKCAIQCFSEVVVRGYLIGEDFGNVRIKLNGRETNYTASQEIVFRLRRGRNEIVVMTDKDVDGVELRVRFFGNGRWIPS